MSQYLSEEESELISQEVEVCKFSNGYRIKDFSSGIATYNRFLKNDAEVYSNLGISQTHLLVNKKNGDVIGYMTLCNDCIKLESMEKQENGLEEVRFDVIPSLKIGQLAISKKYRETGIHYGSFLLEIAKAKIYQLNNLGIACRFLTIDADIENLDSQGRDVTYFYLKNGFKLNNHTDYQDLKTKSMRYDVFGQE